MKRDGKVQSNIDKEIQAALNPQKSLLSVLKSLIMETN